MMPTTFVIGIVFVAICILYGWASSMYKSPKVDIVFETEAGNTSDCKPLSTYQAPTRIIKMKDGTILHSDDFIRIAIHGWCMKPRNIWNGEEWLVTRIDKSKDLKSQIKEKDVLLLYIEDKKIYKIRELKEFLENGMLRTGYYNEDGSEQDSSKNHSLEQVKGVVKYAI